MRPFQALLPLAGQLRPLRFDLVHGGQGRRGRGVVVGDGVVADDHAQRVRDGHAATGETPADQEVAETLRRAEAPVIMAINKADNEKLELQGHDVLAYVADVGQNEVEEANLASAARAAPARPRAASAATASSPTPSGSIAC